MDHAGFSRVRPELLAPAGDMDSVRAAVENGADAVYFGLRSGLNARARAANFLPEELPDLMAYLHLRGVRGYLTLNTLVFPGELGRLEQAVRTAVRSGVDAALLQDLGAVRLARAVAPDWPIHASTQMSLTSGEGVCAAERLGIRRVVLARELSIEEIRRIRGQTRLELEVFVHGALCMSYSGQCLASFALGGRSGNRGRCAQACRLPYELICDGRQAGTPDRRFLLSPLDLAAYDLLPELIAAGVDAVKIEGRLKSAEYVAGAVCQYRRAIDAAAAGERLRLSPQEIAELEGPFSRGFSHGWLQGPDEQLVPGRTSANRGVLVGEVCGVRAGRVLVDLAGPIRRGDGVVFRSEPLGTVPIFVRRKWDCPLPPDQLPGGRVYEIFRGSESLTAAVAAGRVELTFGRGALDLGRVRPGQKVWKTDDSQLGRRLRRSFSAARPRRRVPLDLTIEAAVGQRLTISARAASGAACQVRSCEPLAEARRHPLTPEVLAEQLGRLGGTVYELRNLEARIAGRPMAPLSVLGRLRHEMVRQLDAAAVAGRGIRDWGLGIGGSREKTARDGEEGAGSREPPAARSSKLKAHSSQLPVWHVLCRDLTQMEAVLAQGASSVIADFARMEDCAEAVARARARAAAILLATPRIQKPGEAEIFAALASCRPDGLVVRNLAAAAFCAQRAVPFVADAALHAANAWTVEYLRELGARRVTVACDLDRREILDLADPQTAPWLEVIVYQHLPMFHTEHCLYRAEQLDAADLSAQASAELVPRPPSVDTLGATAGSSSSADNTVGQANRGTRHFRPVGAPAAAAGPGTACQRPCRRHDVRLRDRRGAEHRLLPDGGCRNTLFSARPRNLLDLVPKLRRRGVRHFRIELLNDLPREAMAALAGRSN
jgi:putative protease